MKNPNIVVDQELWLLITEIEEFKGQWRLLKTLSPERLASLRKIATIESVGSSTRIEGSKLSDLEVEALLSNIKSTSFKSRDEQEVAGYAEAMDLVFESFDDISITENHIKQLHQLLLKHSTKDEHHKGSYKILPNHVVAIEPSGKEIGIVFETATPFDTPREMQELILWFNKIIDERILHPLVAIAIFIAVFLAIHPFQDGNGRLSRILTTLLLLRMGYGYAPYASLESLIEENKDLYYEALRRTQISLRKEKEDWAPWVGFFLRALLKQKNRLNAKLAEQDMTSQDLPTLSLTILELLRIKPRMTMADIVASTKANQNTIKLRIRELVASSLITRHGKARATWYRIK